MQLPLLRRALPVLLLALGLAGPLGATWSIVAVNARTGEVAVASATCLLNTKLQELVPALVVGQGVGAAQSAGDSGAINRMIMFADFQAGMTADEVFEDIVLNGAGALQSRQFGIVTLGGAPLTFTGTGAGAAALGVTGDVAGIRYAIQGNVLAGDPVILECERAFRATAGDLTQRMMAAMEAARAWGGDGRCSCSGGNPTGCGSPPPSFQKTNHTAFVYVARIGDSDGTCNATTGCASGSYYLKLARRSRTGKTDPVILLQNAYENWRDSWKGRPDHVLSRVSQTATAAPADGRTTVDFRIALVDIDGVPLTTGGAEVDVTPEQGLAAVSPVTDHGDGTYSFRLTAGTAAGTESLRITADDTKGEVTLFPFPTVRLDPVDRLHVGVQRLSVSAGGSAPFVIQDPGLVDYGYVLLATSSGTVPGQRYGSLTLPLNADPVFAASLGGAGGVLLPGSVGVLDDDGRAMASFVAPPGLLLSLVEAHLDWAVVFLGATPTVSNVVGLDLDL